MEHDGATDEVGVIDEFDAIGVVDAIVEDEFVKPKLELGVALGAIEEVVKLKLELDIVLGAIEEVMKLELELELEVALPTVDEVVKAIMVKPVKLGEFDDEAATEDDEANKVVSSVVNTVVDSVVVVITVRCGGGDVDGVMVLVEGNRLGRCGNHHGQCPNG